MNKIIEAKMLSKTFSNDCVQQHVLKNLDIEIYEGDFTVIMGASGSGKSTLIQHMNALLLPTSGSVSIGDKVITPKKNKNPKGIGSIQNRDYSKTSRICFVGECSKGFS